MVLPKSGPLSGDTESLLQQFRCDVSVPAEKTSDITKKSLSVRLLKISSAQEQDIVLTVEVINPAFVTHNVILNQDRLCSPEAILLQKGATINSKNWGWQMAIQAFS